MSQQQSVNIYLWLTVGGGIGLILVHRINDVCETVHKQGFINPAQMNLEIHLKLHLLTFSVTFSTTSDGVGR